MLRGRMWWFGLMVLLLSAACQPIVAPEGTLPARETGPVATPTVSEENANMPTTPQVEQAINDLAERLQVEPQTIEIVRVETVTWPDGSLGCPQPGMMYTQALVDGSFIQLQVDDQQYNYHSGSAGAPFLCESADELLPEDLGAGPA